ncbi:MAG: hypothetical protein NVSMB65_00130 [Chloroflexota bacterium]
MTNESGGEAPYTPGRRLFLEIMMVALGGLMAVVLSIPVIGALLTPLLRAPAGVWRAVGPVNRFVIGHTVEVTYMNPAPLPWAGQADKGAVWLRRDTPEGFTALSLYCQHLGCPVRWEQASQLFFCPCHGGAYYADGAVAAGPPPKPLTKFRVRVRGDQVEVFTEPIPVPY